MNILIVDNVNNLSGAPKMASELRLALSRDYNVKISSIRKQNENYYQSDIYGSKTKYALIGYCWGLAVLVFNPKFWQAVKCSDIVIYNTILTFPLQILILIFRKNSIAYVHESTEKNILYKFGIFVTKKLNKTIVTPSRLAFENVFPRLRYTVIPNTIEDTYLAAEELLTQREKRDEILFLGTHRKEKGSMIVNKFYNSMSSFKLYCPGKLVGQNVKYGPQTYKDFNFMLVLEDQRFWQETFSLITFEAASCGCLPLMNSKYLHQEYWSDFPELLVNNSDDIEVVLDRLSNDQKLISLQKQVAKHAKVITSRIDFERRWVGLIENELL